MISLASNRTFYVFACLSVLFPAVNARADQPEHTNAPTTSRRGMVVAVCPLAAQEGFEALKRGGNAVDAAVATAFALAVTWPEAGNIGGGGFMLVHPGKGKQPIVVDYREIAPALATESMFAGAKPSEYQLVGVPGTVAGLALAHEKFGKLRWRDLVLPAVRLAEEGFTVHRALADSLNKALRSSAADSPEFVRVYSKRGDDNSWQPGDRMVLRELAVTLKRIADHGADGFYKGATADLLVSEMKRGGGLIRDDDLRNYRAKLRPPIHGTFRGYHIYGPPPPSSGGIALVEMLNILENFELSREGRYSAATLHWMVESMRRVYYDRARYLGDSDFVEIPTHLVTKEYAKKLATEIDRQQATSSRSLSGEIEISKESPQTTHFSVVDAGGMAVANTYTLEESYGSRIVVRGAGFLLNNEMGDFNPQPGVTDESGKIGTKPNRVAPGKRMLSSMTPVVVTTPSGDLLLVTGSPGGRTIINTVACVVLNVVEFNMSPADAVTAPRLHHAWFPDRIQAESALLRNHPEAVEQLKRMGHTIVPIGAQGDAHTIWIDPKTGIVHGVPDRRAGAAIGN